MRRGSRPGQAEPPAPPVRWRGLLGAALALAGIAAAQAAGWLPAWIFSWPRFAFLLLPAIPLAWRARRGLRNSWRICAAIGAALVALGGGLEAAGFRGPGGLLVEAGLLLPLLAAGHGWLERRRCGRPAGSPVSTQP